MIAGYRLLRLLGQGTQSRVYLAEHLGASRLVALKVGVLTSPGSGHVGGHAEVQTFLAAARTAQALLHPDIVHVLAAGVEGSLLWLAMDPVPGTNLTRYTRPPRLLPEPVAVRLAARLAAALAHAHRQGVVHRDLKPDNVLIDWANDTVKLADFGLARVGGAADTGTGIVLGTPVYMAPEQLAGAVPGPAADVYALGVVLFELLTGRLPHEAPSMGDLLRQVAQEPAPDLLLLRPDLPPALALALAGMLAKAPTDRPADGRVLAAALSSLGQAMTGAGAKSR